MRHILFFVVVAAVALLAFSFIYDRNHDVQSFGCDTGGAKLHYRSTDGNLHLTLWCTKDGRIVP